jgi:hypothetical protein
VVDLVDALAQVVECGNAPFEKGSTARGDLDTLLVRSTMRTPRVLSRSAIVFETTGREIDRLSAAFAMFCRSATAIKT